MPAVSTYECVLLFDPELGKDQLGAAQGRIEEVLRKGGGEVALWDHWGERRLAYDIKKKSRAHFSIAYIRASNEARAELARSLKYAEDVIRYMIVKPFEEPDLAAISAKNQAKAELAARNQRPGAAAPAPQARAVAAEPEAVKEETTTKPKLEATSQSEAEATPATPQSQAEEEDSHE